MATAYIVSLEAAELFYSVCESLKADTEEQRVEILKAMGKLGMLKNIVETNKTKEEYIAHLKKHFTVADINPSSLSEQDDKQEK